MNTASAPGVVTFRGKVDFWIGLLLFDAVLIPVAIGMVQHLYSMYVAALVVAAAILGWMAPQSYTLTENALVIRSGLTKRVIPYRDITDVRRCRHLRRSAALSLDRLEVTLHYRRSLAVHISPVRPAEFARELASRLPHYMPRTSPLRRSKQV